MLDLREDMLLKVDGEVLLISTKAGDKVILKSLYSTFSSFGSMIVI